VSFTRPAAEQHAGHRDVARSRTGLRRDTGLAEPDKLSVMLPLSGFVRNATLLA
jgi:hypothetical protein